MISIFGIVLIAATMVSIFGIILIAAAMTHRHENSAKEVTFKVSYLPAITPNPWTLNNLSSHFYPEIVVACGHYATTSWQGDTSQVSRF